MNNILSVVYGYRFCRPGARGYTYLEDGKEICATSELENPKSPIRISGISGASWESDFNRDTTYFPGLRLYVVDTATSRRVVQLVFMSFSSYVIHCGADTITSAENPFGFWYYQDEELIASCSRNPKHAPYIEVFGERLPAYYEVRLRKKLSEQTKQALLAFPSLVRPPPR